MYNKYSRWTEIHRQQLRSGLHGLAPLLSELVLEPLFIGGCRLKDLLELSLKVGNPLFLLLGMLQQVGPALGPLY
jgi:hypothetical protein